MSDDRKPGVNLGRAAVGIIIVFVGVGFLLESVFDVDFELGELWPLILIIYGALNLPSRDVRGLMSFPGVVLLVGGLILFLNLVGMDFSLVDLFSLWPILLILVGLRILWKAWARSRGPAAMDEEAFPNIMAVFSGSEKRYSSPRFRGADVTSIFGSVEMDLRDAEPVPEGAVIDLFVLFGGVELRVPREWRVVDQATPLFGSVEHKQGPAEPAAVEGGDVPRPVLTLRGLVLFGSAELK